MIKKSFPSAYKPFRARLPSKRGKSANDEAKTVLDKTQYAFESVEKVAQKVQLHAKKAINERVMEKLSFIL